MGRQEELQVLNRICESSLRGEMAFVVLQGPRGIGKHRLIEEFLHTLPLSSFQVYKFSPETFLRWVFGGEATRSPMAVFPVLEGLERLKEPQLARLFQGLSPLLWRPVMFLAPVEVSERSPFFETLARRFPFPRHLHRLRLGPLSREETETLLNRAFPGVQDPVFGTWLFQLTRGVPWLLNEVLEALKEAGLLYERQGVWGLSPRYVDFRPTPRLVRLLLQGIERLSKREQLVLHTLALLQEPLPSSTLRHLYRIPEGAFLRIFDRLRGEGWIREEADGKVRLASPLLQKALLASLGRERELVLRQRLYQTLLEIPGMWHEAVRQLRHLPGAVSPQDFGFLAEAARRFLESGELQEAEAVLRMMRGLVEEGQPKWWVLWKILAEAVRTIQGEELLRPGEVVQLVSWALREGAAPYGLLLLDAYLHALVRRGIFSARVLKELREGLRSFPDQESLEVLFKLQEVAWLRERMWEREAFRLLEEVRPKVDPQKAPFLYRFSLSLQMTLGLTFGRLQEAERAIRALLDFGVRKPREPLHRLGQLYAWMGRLPEARRVLETYAEECREMGQIGGEAMALKSLAVVYRYQGDGLRALAHIERAIGLGLRGGLQDYLPGMELERASALLLLGRREEARQVLQALEPRVAHIPIPLLSFLLRKAELAWEEGDPEEARALARKVQNLARRAGRVAEEGMAHVLLARCALYFGDPQAARRHFQRALQRFRSRGLTLYEPFAQVGYGLSLGGEEGDRLVAEGILGLAAMEAWPRLLALRDPLAMGRFPRSRRLLEEVLGAQGRGDIQVQTLGEFTLVFRHPPRVLSGSDWPSHKAQMLFVLLLLHPRGLGREELMEALWPEKSPERAARVFHVTLNQLRSAVGHSLILRQGWAYQLDDRRLWVDAHRFETLYRAFREGRARGENLYAELQARRALELYRGPFIPGLYLPEAEDYRSLLEARAEELRGWIQARESWARRFLQSTG